MKTPASRARGSASVWRKAPPARDVDEYLARIPDGPRAALEKLRRTIRAAAPEATECVSYRLPAFRHDGVLVSYGAAEKHCALYVMSPAVMKAHARELEKYETSAGTVRFRAEKPLPAALVRKLVRARVAENEAARR